MRDSLSLAELVPWFRTARQARCAERELIKSLNPAFNAKPKPANAEPRPAKTLDRFIAVARELSLVA